MNAVPGFKHIIHFTCYTAHPGIAILMRGSRYAAHAGLSHSSFESKPIDFLVDTSAGIQAAGEHC